MNRQALLYKMTSVFIWAMYPVFIALGSSESSLAWFIVIVHASAALGATLCGIMSLKSGKSISTLKHLLLKLREQDIDRWIFIFAAGLCSTLYNLCFLYAMVWTSKAGVAVIIETAPVYAMLLTSVIVTRNWESLGIKHALVTALILIGVGLVVLADQKDITRLFTDYDNYIRTGDFMSLMGCFVALIGSLMSALSDLMRAQAGNVTIRYIPSDSTRFDHELTGIMFGEAIVRIVALPIAGLVLLVFNDVSVFSAKDTIYAFIAGFIIFNFGSITYAAALLKSNNPAIALLDYLSPPLSIFILVLLGLSSLHPYLVIGTVMIIFGNLFLYLFDRKNVEPIAQTKHHP